MGVWLQISCLKRKAELAAGAPGLHVFLLLRRRCSESYEDGGGCFWGGFRGTTMGSGLLLHTFSLQANLPLLQRELLHCARMAKQSPAQYLAQHEQLLLDANASSPIDSSELLLEVSESGKRRTPDR